MQIIPSDNVRKYRKDDLRLFLSACREAAIEKEHFQLASISMEVDFIEPLAVLDSISEAGEQHFYVERPSKAQALAGAEALAEGHFSGAERFQALKDFAEDILKNTIAVGDLSAPFAGPHFFTAFTFESTVSGEAAFPAASVFVPRWQVSRMGNRYGAVANVRIEADGDLDSVVDRVWTAYEKFTVFNYEANPQRDPPAATEIKVVKDTELGERPFAELVEAALADIGNGSYDKIVLSRVRELVAASDWQPLEVLNRLRGRFNDCYTFSFGNGKGSSFIGASPERLLKIREGRLRTEAIAGSAPRGATAADDARLARALLNSKKDLWEHACVRDSIIRRLFVRGISGRSRSGPNLLPLANVQHLRTPIEAEVKRGVPLLDIAEELHPTPAVGGTPREAALDALPKLESSQRGLYAGALGWFNHLNEGELIVGIRSALIQGKTVQLYAGAGVVDGSTPQGEISETDMKLRALYEALVPEG
ncbi:MAG: isochorismate synthase [Verrucomicrobia bacterium]|nr:isochorismate synthase [Verrucomicrobiota bacterium]